MNSFPTSNIIHFVSVDCYSSYLENIFFLCFLHWYYYISFPALFRSYASSLSRCGQHQKIYVNYLTAEQPKDILFLYPGAPFTNMFLHLFKYWLVIQVNCGMILFIHPQTDMVQPL